MFMCKDTVNKLNNPKLFPFIIPHTAIICTFAENYITNSLGMEQTFNLPAGLSKGERYEAFVELYEAFIMGESDWLAALANTAAALREAFGFFWVGFYLVATEEWLTLGPFQGSVACSRIRRGRGVCGTAWAEGRTVIVEDVDAFPGHIACSCLSRSEIVVPIYGADGSVVGVLDVDSDRFAAFDTDDQQGLERIVTKLSHVIVSAITHNSTFYHA